MRVPSHDHCHPIPLAHGPVGQVEACTCGAVRLSVGPLTLRFEVASFLALVDLLEHARERLLCGSARPLNPGQAARVGAHKRSRMASVMAPSQAVS